MSTAITNFLRRTVVGLGTGLALVAANAAFAQGTVTLQGANSNTCSYSGVSVSPNGAIVVTCAGSPPPTNNQVATFSLTHASSATNYVLSPFTSSSASISRNGGPAGEALMVTYGVSGTGCSNGSGGIMLLNGTSQTIPFSVGAPGTSCTVTIIAPSGGHVASPNTLTFTAQSTSNPGPGPISDCPAVPTSAVAGNTRVNDFVYVDELKMGSGSIAYYAVPDSINPMSVISDFSQTQMANTPANVTTEFQVSPCPGVWDPPGHSIAPECRYGPSTSININNFKIWNAPVGPFVDQAAIAYRGCFAPRANRQYYINVRWAYPSCPFGNGCGFSIRWLPRASND